MSLGFLHKGLFLFLVFWSSSSFSEEVEIFIPGSKVDVQNDQKGSSLLARCINSGLPEYCSGIQLTGDGTVFESFDETQITLETLIFTNDDVTVKDKDNEDQNTTSDTNLVKTAVGIEILFDYDSFVVRSDQAPKIEELTKAFNDPLSSDGGFAVIGHTDAKGSDRYNCKLSNGRSASVITALKLNGATALLYPVGVGEFLLKDKDNPESARNRRVSILKINSQEKNLVGTMEQLCRLQ